MQLAVKPTASRRPAARAANARAAKVAGSRGNGWLTVAVTLWTASTFWTGGAAADWPQFRGPAHDGSSTHDGIPTRNDEPPIAAWNQSPPREIWRRPLGEGFSSVAISGDALYTAFSDDQTEYLGRFRASDGAEVWRLALGKRFEDSWGNGPRSTPSVAGDLVVALGSFGRLVGVAAADGKLLWQHELAELDGIQPPHFGYSPSVLLWDDRVLTEVGASENGLIRAFRQSDGRPLWSTESGRAGYSTPILATLADVEQAVFLTRGEALAVDIDGAVLWRWPFTGGSPFDLPIAAPLAIGEDRVFVSHWADGGSALLAVSTAEPSTDPNSGALWTVETTWESARMLNHLGASVSFADHLFGFHNATLQAVSARDGAVSWRLRGLGKGTLIRIGSQLVVLSDSGELLQIAANPATLEELGRYRVFSERTWAAPSFSDGALYLRSSSEMVAVAISTEERSDSAAPAAVAGQEATAEPHAPNPVLDLHRVLELHLQAVGVSPERQRPNRNRPIIASGSYITNGLVSPFELSFDGRHSIERQRSQGPDSDSEPVLERVDDQGGTAWHPGSTSPSAMNEEQIHSLRLEVELLRPAILPSATDRAQFLGIESFDTGSGLLVEIEPANGWTERWFLDPQTYLPLALFTERWTWGRVRAMRYYFADWRKVDGYHVPFRIEDEFGSFHRVLTLDTVDFSDPPSVLPQTDEELNRDESS